MRTITPHIDPKFDDRAETWLAHLILALPVSPNEGIWFDKAGDRGTVVNLRDPIKGWLVSFRDGTGNPDHRHYANPRNAARAVITGQHNGGGTHDRR